MLDGERDRLAGQTLGLLHIPAIEMKRGGEAQRLRQRVAVGGLLRQAERLVARAQRLLGVAEHPEHPGKNGTAVHPGTGDEVEGGVAEALVALVEGVRLLELHPRLGELAEEMQRRSQHPMGRHQDGRLVVVLRQRQALLAQLPCLAKLGAQQMNVREPDEHRDELRGVRELLAQGPRSKVGLLHLRIGEALGGDQGRTERHQEVQLRGVPVRPRRQGLQQAQSLAEMLDGFALADRSSA